MNVTTPRNIRTATAFVPEPEDVRETRSILASRGLPTELALLILDFARYWVENTTETIEHRVLFDEGWSLDFTLTDAYLWVPLQLAQDHKGEHPKIREIEYNIVSHDQGWTTEDTAGSYKTTSWFEVSQVRPLQHFNPGFRRMERFLNIEHARQTQLAQDNFHILPRPSTEMETHRLHCHQMRKVTWPPESVPARQEIEEGTHGWYLQGNQVARGTSIFHGEMVKRYRVVWGCAANPRWEGNEGAGRGDGFIDSLQEDDWIVVWARAKRRGWDNHVFGVRVTVRYTI